jgi:glycosyltransferase involved in cell wall biosynthesis
MIENLPLVGYLLFVVSGSYALFTLLLVYFWLKIPSRFQEKANRTPLISVVVPVRNEAQNIQKLLADLAAQSLNKTQFEVIVVDDASTDDTKALVHAFKNGNSINLTLIELENIATTSPKKRAIETAIQSATGELIITTDGDCRVGPGWLAAFSNCYASTGARLISGPVTFSTPGNFTDHLQTVEFASLIGSGASAISAGFATLCNGANLCYEKQAFLDVNGFEGVRHVASGDDEFLMHKIAAVYPDGIQFLKSEDGVVKTHPHREWTPFFRQRKRWASKWKHYQSKAPLSLALYVFTCNLAWIATLALWLTGTLPFSTVAILFTLKWVPEWLFLSTILRFLGQNNSIIFIPATQILYPFYVCFFGLAVQKPTYQWKGRHLK